MLIQIAVDSLESALLPIFFLMFHWQPLSSLRLFIRNLSFITVLYRGHEYLSYLCNIQDIFVTSKYQAVKFDSVLIDAWN